VSKTAYIAEGAYAFEMTNTHEGGICCQYGAGKFKITVNGEQEPSAAEESFETSFGKASTGSDATGPTVAYRTDVAYDEHPYETLV
jgi:hypothetical protein